MATFERVKGADFIANIVTDGVTYFQFHIPLLVFYTVDDVYFRLPIQNFRQKNNL